LTPVTAIRSAVETLATIPAQDAPARERFLGILDRNAARLKQLVDDLLDLSRIEARELSLSAEPIDLRAMLEHVAELFAERAARTQTPIAVRIDAPELELRADARALDPGVRAVVREAPHRARRAARAARGTLALRRRPARRRAWRAPRRAWSPQRAWRVRG
jgi:two-component system phosphate regulon sensor histidine kinase PhoR